MFSASERLSRKHLQHLVPNLKRRTEFTQQQKYVRVQLEGRPLEL